MTKLDVAWLHDSASQTACAFLTDAGFRAWFVGGCVRDGLMGMESTDIDICTDAPPQTVIDLADKAGLRSFPSGIEHGTVTILVNHQAFEITTLRRDVQTDGRRAVVAFSKNIEDDARRRDFTINALYALPDGTVIDPLGGLPDLAARRVRFIEDAEARIKEDYLRILRFFRFSATHSDPAHGIEAAGLAACAANVGGLETLSKERVGQEMRKLLRAPDPAPALAAMDSAGALMRILPGASAAMVAPLVHIEQALQIDPDHLRRLAALGGENPTENLRLSKVETRQLGHLLTDESDPATLGYRFGMDVALGVLALQSAGLGQMPSDDAITVIGHAATQKLPVTGADFSAHLEGQEIGIALATAEKRWIASGFSLTRDELLA